MFRHIVDVRGFVILDLISFRTVLRVNPSGRKKGGSRKADKNFAAPPFSSPTGCPLRLPFPSPLFFPPARFFSRILYSFLGQAYSRIYVRCVLFDSLTYHVIVADFHITNALNYAVSNQIE